MKSKYRALIFLSLFFTGAAVGQEVPSLYCGTEGEEIQTKSVVLMSMTADDTYGKYLTSNGTLKVLVVFVRFPDDNSTHFHWTNPSSSWFPSMADEFIDSTITQGSTNEYNITNYFDQMSLGSYKVIGDIVKVVAPNNRSHYSNYYEANKQILQHIDSTTSITFSDYDNWTGNSSYSHDNSSDGIVDMIFMIYKGHQFGSWTGIADMGGGSSITVDGGNTTIKFGFWSVNNGSGVTINDNHNTQRALNTAKHELGHWILGAGHPYSGSTDNRIPAIMQHGQNEGLSANAPERERLGWINVPEITSTTIAMELDDYLTTGEAYKYDATPSDSNDDEYYYITNHQKLSIYDDVTRNASDKGLFILHDENSTSNSPSNRMLVSDGNYIWDEDGVINNPWGAGQLSVFYKDYPSQSGKNITQKHYSSTQNNFEKLFIYEEDGDTTQGALFTGREFITSFNKNNRPLFSSISNPAAHNWAGSITGFKLHVQDQLGSTVEFDVYTNFNSSSLNISETWDRQIFLDQNSTVSNSATISVLDETSIFPTTSQIIDFDNTSTLLLDSKGAKTTVTIEDGVTINMNSGANLELESGTGGLAANKTTLIVKGVLNINSGSTVDLGDHALIIAEDGGQVNVSSGATINSTVIGEFNAGNNGLVTFTGNHSFNTSICLMTLPGGTMEFNGTLILDNGAFIQTHSTGGGTYIFNDNVTLKGSGNSAGYVMDLNEGSTVEIGYNKRILTYNGAKMRSVGIQSNSVRFTYIDPAGYPDEAWDNLELRGDGNIFEYAVFEYGVNPLYFRSDNNEVSYSNIKNNLSYGIRTDSDYSGGWGSVKVTDSKIENNGSHGIYVRNSYVGIEYNDIKNNSGDGIYVYNAEVGYPSASGSGYFRGNDIAGNSSNAVQVAYNGEVNDGFSTVYGHNQLDNNGSHAIYLSSSNARWWDGYGGGYTAVLEPTTSTKYVYNLAQTTSGESTVSWTVGVENYAWDYATPSSSRFHGSVDYTPYQTSQMFGSVGPRGTVPAKIMRSGAVNFGQSVLSSATASEATESFTTNEDRDYYLEVRKEIARLRSEINGNPNHAEVPRKLNGLLGYYNELPSDSKTEFPTVKPLIASFVSDRHLQGITRGVSQNERLASETALMLEAHQHYEEGNPEGALATIVEVEGIIANIDLQRELGFIKAASLEDLGEYQQAIDVYLSLSELSKRGIDPENTATDYADEIAHLEERIFERDGVEVDTQRDGEGKIKVASDTMPTEIALHAAYPNPFNPSTVLSFDLPDAGVVKVEVFDVNGRLVSVLTNQVYQAGTHSLQFDAGTLASGIYLIRADIAGSIQTQKITLIK